MVEERIQELIQQEIDGANSPEESAELHRHLAADREARAMFESLRQLGDALRGMRPADPPADLTPSVLAAVGSRPRSTVRTLGMSGALKYAYAAAAGLVLGVLLAPTIREWIQSGGLADPARVIGTIAGGRWARVTGMIEQNIAADGLTGLVRLSQTGNLLQFQLDLTAAQPVEVVLEYDARCWRLRGIEQDAEMAFQAADQRLSILHQGRNRYRVTMARLAKEESKFLWNFYRSGALLHRASFSLLDPAAARR